ncbi:hypothetical protein MKEN_00704800 [Mycena kentingensis (nom. inval.)]|nr:hypothetical protein MKEN_00704800 [Mycena kentingensis (nom. inval.)]
MFAFTKSLSICLLLLAPVAVRAAPITEGQDLAMRELDDAAVAAIESVLQNLPPDLESSFLESFAAATADPDSGEGGEDEDSGATDVFTIISTLDGPAITLATDGITTEFGGATWTIQDPAAETGLSSVSMSDESASSTSTDRAPSSTTSSQSAASSSRRPSGAATRLEPIAISGTVARILLTVVVGIAGGALCL